MARRYHRPIKPETIRSVLLYLRDEIEREGLGGGEHVAALLAIRGWSEDAPPVPKRAPKHFGKGELRREVLTVLRDGPLRGREIAERVHARHRALTFAQVHKRVYLCLNVLKARGVVRNANGAWSPTSQ